MSIPAPALGWALRDAEDSDVPAIHAIYAHFVEHTLWTLEEAVPGLEEMARRMAEVRRHGLPFLVAEGPRGVVGYACATPYRLRSAYRFTVEDSIFVLPEAQGGGLGRALLSELIARCEAAGCRQMVAVIGSSLNETSIRFHRRMGFRRAGLLEASGYKFGTWVDCVLMQRALGPGGGTAPGEPPEAA